jgi:protein-tyrosine phosphatase
MLEVCFVCTGNICRSPAAALVFEEELRRAGIDQQVLVTSCGVDSWHVGQPIDRRSKSALEDAGYPVHHRASQLGEEHREVDLFLAMDQSHYEALTSWVNDPTKVRMFRSFDPSATHLDIPDPYYGGQQGFTNMLATIEAAMPNLLTWTKDQL